jgi:hypothetical protein
MASVGSNATTIWAFPLGICGEKLVVEEILK